MLSGQESPSTILVVIFPPESSCPGNPCLSIKEQIPESHPGRRGGDKGRGTQPPGRAAVAAEGRLGLRETARASEGCGCSVKERRRAAEKGKGGQRGHGVKRAGRRKGGGTKMQASCTVTLSCQLPPYSQARQVIPTSGSTAPAAAASVAASARGSSTHPSAS